MDFDCDQKNSVHFCSPGRGAPTRPLSKSTWCSRYDHFTGPDRENPSIIEKSLYRGKIPILDHNIFGKWPYLG